MLGVVEKPSVAAEKLGSSQREQFPGSRQYLRILQFSYCVWNLLDSLSNGRGWPNQPRCIGLMLSSWGLICCRSQQFWILDCSNFLQWNVFKSFSSCCVCSWLPINTEVFMPSNRLWLGINVTAAGNHCTVLASCGSNSCALYQPSGMAYLSTDVAVGHTSASEVVSGRRTCFHCIFAVFAAGICPALFHLLSRS